MLKRIASLSVRSQLLLITLIIALPAIGMIVIAGIQSRNEAIRDSYKLTSLVAERVAFGQQNMATAAEQLLLTLSQLPEVRQHDASRVAPLLRQLNDINTQYANIFVADVEGNVWASAIPFLSKPNVADRRYFRDAIATGKLVPGEYIISRTIGKPAFNFAYPYRDLSGKINGIIAVGVALESFSAIVQSPTFPQGTNFLLIDQNGTILNRALHDDLHGSGHTYPPKIFQAMVAGPEEYSYRGRGALGDERFISYRKIRLKGQSKPYMYVRAGIPVSVVLKTANRDLLVNLVTFGCILLCSFAAANYIGRKSLVERIELLKDAVVRTSSGEKGVSVSSVLVGGELGNLAQCFDAMANQLHQREHALLDSTQKLQNFIANAPVILFVIDKEGILTFSDGKGLNSLGLKPGQVVGLSAFDLYADSPTALEGVTRALRGETCCVETTVGEKIFEVWYSPHCNSHGEFVGAIGVATVITERKLAEQSLRESEEKYRNLVDNLKNAVVYQIAGDIEGNRRFAYISRAVEHMNEVSVELVLADAGVIYRQILPEFHELLRALEEEAINNVSSMQVVVQSRLPSGRLRWFEYTAVPRKSRNGQIVWDGIEVDVTERKHVEEELLKAKTVAEAASTAKTEFLANMSHEIRTPMNGVIGNIQLLRFTNLDDEQETLLDNIETDSKSLVEVINDVLDISKIEAGKLEIEYSSFSLKECLNDVLKPLELRLHAKNLSLHSSIEGDGPDALIGDHLRLKQILRNLLGNAIKFTEAGGVEVRVKRLESDGADVQISFSVIDTGIGIKQEALEKIFAPFSQADSSVTRRFGGTGLGLAICNRLTRLMGGKIDVESAEDKGSTFRVILPFKVDKQPLAPQERLNARQSVNGKPLRILLVDDNHANREMMARLLHHVGHQVSSASDGSEALEKWRESLFDIILMDIQMPVMDGLEAIGIIRGNEKENGGHIPVIALTAHALAEQRDHLLNSGFDGYVSKPVDFSLLQAEIKRLDGSAS